MPSLLHTGLTVRDLERSLGFYRDLLGMEVVFAQEKQGGYLAEIVGYPDAHVRMAHLAFTGDAQRIELFEYLVPAPAQPGRASPHRDHAHLSARRGPRRHARAAARSRVAFVSPPVLVDTGANAGGLGLYLHDPDGALVELFQPPSDTAEETG